MPPRLGGSLSTLLLASESEDGMSSISTDVNARALIALAHCRGGDSDNSVCRASWISDVLFFRLWEWKIARKLARNPFFRLSTGFALSLAGSDDLCRFFLERRFRSLFDLTRPMHETFGDDGSTIGPSDFPTDPERFGNRWIPALQYLRFFASMKVAF
jgi:hypothetical protein